MQLQNDVSDDDGDDDDNNNNNNTNICKIPYFLLLRGNGHQVPINVISFVTALLRKLP